MGSQGNKDPQSNQCRERHDAVKMVLDKGISDRMAIA